MSIDREGSQHNVEAKMPKKKMKKGAKITVLARKAPLYYVETTVSGKTYRGYVESECLNRD